MSNNKKFDLNLLKVFDAIYKLGTITRAARHLNVSQPAVSHGLVRLREIYNDPLFSRSPNRMKPTPIANEIALNIDKTLQQTQISLAKAGRFDHTTSDRHFRLLMNTAHGSAILPQLMSNINTAAPSMTFEVCQYHHQNALEELLNGEADFIVNHSLPEHPQIRKKTIAKQEYVCLVSHDHPCAKTGINLKQYLSYPHIHTSSRLEGENYVDMALQAIGKSRKIVCHTQDYLIAPYALIDSTLILTSPKSIASSHDCVMFALPFTVKPVDIYLYWHISRDADPASLWLRQKNWKNTATS